MPDRVDLNADMGESYGRWTLGDDAALMPHLTSANIACGFHGGDPHVMRHTVALAVEHGVGIGAHVAYPDLIGFGRRRMSAAPDEVADYIVYQSGAVKAFAETAGARLQHVKPHGALYTSIVDDPELAQAAAQAVASLGSDGAGKLVIERAKQIRDPEQMGEKAVRLIREGKVRTTDGGDLELDVQSICVHGDAPNAPEIARAIRGALEAAGIELAPLADLQSVAR